MATLESNRYGKFRVRVMKVIRHDATHHDVCELEADVLLQGDLAGSYLSDDNLSIVPTDTVKNTVHFLAHDHLETCRTSFARVIGEHFLGNYPHLTGVEVELRERRWARMEIVGESHPHAFVHAANGEWYSRGYFTRGQAPVLSSGIRGHLVMKTTGSGFENYNVCELTTLPPTNDRVFATRMNAEWTFADLTADFCAADAAVLAVAHTIFATTYSPSVQRTLYEIGEQALASVPSISRIELKMPNVHFLNLDLSKLGRPGQKTVLLPTDEPHGEIEAIITR
ncbi:factor-independent urate hydroxylase [Haloferula sp. BvORR071]|uniref:factor-independent urate hydroxylase n=1 Tax=Haloferula sp. BvORR071 TaxID=1396141 RepID=UPI000552167E|nr:urate oxidase [Haloferula sp. BvORR071]